MAVISGANYVKIATSYGNARDQILSSIQFLFDAVYEVVLIKEIIPEVDLLDEFYNSYQINSNVFKSPVTLLQAVRSLNNHVLNRGGFADINAFFAAQPHGTVVPRAWADLSSAVGFSIHNIYVV